MLDGLGLPLPFAAARLGLELLLASYLLAGVANLPRFPRALRGPATPATADAALLDMWCLIAVAVGIAIAFGGSAAGLP